MLAGDQQQRQAARSLCAHDRTRARGRAHTHGVDVSLSRINVSPRDSIMQTFYGIYMYGVYLNVFKKFRIKAAALSPRLHSHCYA